MFHDTIILIKSHCEIQKQELYYVLASKFTQATELWPFSVRFVLIPKYVDCLPEDATVPPHTTKNMRPLPSHLRGYVKGFLYILRKTCMYILKRNFILQHSTSFKNF